MKPTTRAAYTRPHLSRHARQRAARVNAFSRRTKTIPIAPPPVTLGTDDLELIDRLMHRDRTGVSTALLTIAGIGAGEAVRWAVLDRTTAAASGAHAGGAISSQRAEQIARHVSRALAEHAAGLPVVRASDLSDEPRRAADQTC
ncbi:MAG: hypothetical protein WCD11_23685 [Solirubrobacteraceae bacterium]